MVEEVRRLEHRLDDDADRVVVAARRIVRVERRVRGLLLVGEGTAVRPAPEHVDELRGARGVVLRGAVAGRERREPGPRGAGQRLRRLGVLLEGQLADRRDVVAGEGTHLLVFTEERDVEGRLETEEVAHRVAVLRAGEPLERRGAGVDARAHQRVGRSVGGPGGPCRGGRAAGARRGRSTIADGARARRHREREKAGMVIPPAREIQPHPGSLAANVRMSPRLLPIR